jgi:predicted nucleic acid-binding protein
VPVGQSDLGNGRGLLSGDLQAGRKLDDLAVVNPFLTAPDEFGFA